MKVPGKAKNFAKTPQPVYSGLCVLFIPLLSSFTSLCSGSFFISLPALSAFPTVPFFYGKFITGQ